jgi:hypothetical protein
MAGGISHCCRHSPPEEYFQDCTPLEFASASETNFFCVAKSINDKLSTRDSQLNESGRRMRRLHGKPSRRISFSRSAEIVR